MQGVPKIKLNNATEIPQLGLGVYKVKDGQVAVDTVNYALKTGYRLVDTAALYGNEESVGEAIRDSGLNREELYITTKLWNTDQGYDSTISAFNLSLKKLGLNYIDLYLIHWPNHDMDLTVETWKAFEEIYESRKVRTIGVSNFKPSHLEYLLKNSKVVPAVNQIELHPYNAQHETREFCIKHNIAVESWSPLMQGGKVLEDPIIVNLSKTYNKTPAQIVIRWHLQNELIVIPKSVTPQRIEENFNVFDFEISSDDLIKINNLDKDQRVGPDPDGMAMRFYNKASRTMKFFKSTND